MEKMKKVKKICSAKNDTKSLKHLQFKKISKLEKNGLRMVDARLETLEEEMKIVWHILDKVENIEKKVMDLVIPFFLRKMSSPIR